MPIASPISCDVPATTSTGTPLMYFNSPRPCFCAGKRKGSLPGARAAVQIPARRARKQVARNRGVIQALLCAAVERVGEIFRAIQAHGAQPEDLDGASCLIIYQEYRTGSTAENLHGLE